MTERYRIEFTHWAESDINEIISYIIEDNCVFIVAVFDGRREIDDIIFRRVTGL